MKACLAAIAIYRSIPPSPRKSDQLIRPTQRFCMLAFILLLVPRISPPIPC